MDGTAPRDEMDPEDRNPIKYLHLLTICGIDWQEKVNLAIFKTMPSDDNIKAVIKLYWSRYEIGLYPAFEDFMEYLKLAGQKDDVPRRLGIWVEKVPTFSDDVPDVSDAVKVLSKGLQEHEDQHERGTEVAGTEGTFETDNRKSED